MRKITESKLKVAKFILTVLLTVYCKYLKIQTPDKIAVIILKIEQNGFTTV